MKHLANTALFVLSLGLATSPLFASPDTAKDLIEQADKIYSQRTPKAGAQEALDLYEKAVVEDPASVEPVWKSARALYWLAYHSEVKKEKIALFEKGIAVAKKGVEMEPKSIESHFWLGGLYGSYGESKGVLKSLALVKPIRQEMDTIIRLDDRFQGGAGYRVLGIVDYKVPGFAGGSRKRALEQLNKALAIDQTNPFNQFYMAEYFSIVGQQEKALEHLKTLEGLTATSDVDEPDLKMMQDKGRKLQESLQK